MHTRLFSICEFNTGPFKRTTKLNTGILATS